MKWLLHALAIGILTFGWYGQLNHSSEASAADQVQRLLEQTTDPSLETLRSLHAQSHGSQKSLLADVIKKVERSDGDPDAIFQAVDAMAKENEDSGLTGGIMWAFLTAIYLGVLFVMHILPRMAQRVTHVAYDSNEQVEKDHMRDARACLAQGNYEGAVEAIHAAIQADPSNRFAWVELSKLQRDQFHDPAAAAATYRQALESHAWAEEDHVFFIFRLAELSHDVLADRATAVELMRRVMELYPETRHSANARHHLHQWGEL